MEYIYETITGLQDKDPIKLKVVEPNIFAYYMVKDVARLTCLPESYIPGLIDSIKAKQGITFSTKNKDQVIQLFKQTLNELWRN